MAPTDVPLPAAGWLRRDGSEVLRRQISEGPARRGQARFRSRRAKSAGSSSTANGWAMRPRVSTAAVVQVMYRPQLKSDDPRGASQFHPPADGIPASTYMTGLTAGSNDTVDGQTPLPLSHACP